MTTPFPFTAGQILTAAQLNDIQNLPISDKTASYVFTATDVYKRTIMNAAGATTLTVNNSIFTVGDVIQVANKGAGTCTITAGAGVTINTSGSLALAQYGGGYLLCLSASTFTFFSLGGVGYGAATGGTSSSITSGGINYTLLSFTSDNSLVVTRTGLFDVTMIAGGGGGGNGSNNAHAGGGGAGGYVTQTIYLTAATYAVTVGAGGAGNWQANRHNGAGSFIGTALSAAGGGNAGFVISGLTAVSGNDGGSGGGACDVQPIGLASGGGIGFNGGLATVTKAFGGGGGGSGAVGAAGSGTTGGAGGAGVDISAWLGQAANTTRIGGGGGGSGTTGGSASDGGGAGGSGTGGTGTAGTANKGGGGGGSFNASGGAGGSGVVYVRFRS
jgi:hypothetical protein